MDIDKRIAPFFESINFAERYIAICNKHAEVKESLDSYDLGLIPSFYSKYDLKMTYIKKEGFFKNVTEIGNFRIQFNVIPRSGYIQFVLDFKIGKERLNLGWGMWESITEELTGIEYTKKPTFCSVKELEVVLDESFMLYNDLKEEIRKNQS